MSVERCPECRAEGKWGMPPLHGKGCPRGSVREVVSVPRMQGKSAYIKATVEAARVAGVDMVTVGGDRCGYPGCGKLLVIRATGRRPKYCSDSHRVMAHRKGKKRG